MNNKKIHTREGNVFAKHPLGGILHVSEMVELESDITFLDNYLSDGLFHLTDIEKLKVMGFIRELTKGRIRFDEALAYIYLKYEKNKKVRAVIKKITGMETLLNKLEKAGVQKQGDLLENIQDFLTPEENLAIPQSVW